jgi:MFS family permease
MGVAAFFWGALSDRFGTRVVVLSGSVLLGIGLVAASQATSLLQFQLLFGVIVGVAAGSFYAPMISIGTAWIEHNRSLAVALVSAGMGIAPLTVAPFVRLLITAYDWRTAMLVIGVVAWLLLIPAALLVRPPPAAPQVTAKASGAPAAEFSMTAAQAFRTPQFAAIALTYFACCAAIPGRSSIWSLMPSAAASHPWPRSACMAWQGCPASAAA